MEFTNRNKMKDIVSNNPLEDEAIYIIREVAAQFEKAFGSPKAQGYPQDRKESQNRNVKILAEVKRQVGKPVLEALRSIDPELLKGSLTQKFQECFFANCQDEEYLNFVKEVLAK